MDDLGAPNPGTVPSEPCPGCGKIDKLHNEVRMITYWNQRGKCFVVCERCGWHGPTKDDCEKAVAAWDKRRCKNVVPDREQ